MKKVEKRDAVVFLLLSVIITVMTVSVISSIVLADVTSDEQEKIPLSYQWLINHTRNNWNNLTIKEDSFSLLALNCNSTYSSQGNKSLYNLSYYNSTQKIRCWKEKGKASSSNDCKLVETSLAKLALSEIDENTSYEDNWLLKQNRTFVTGIYWFLEIDVARGKQANCEIMYGNTMQNVSIDADKKVHVNSAGDCIMNKPFMDYWFKINPTEACYNQEYLIKCFGNESGGWEM